MKPLPDALRPWLGAVMISFSAVWVRLADVEPARSALLRVVYALPVLAVLVALRGGSGRRWLVPGALVAGLALGIDFVAWHESIERIGAGLSTVLANLQVVFVGLAGVLLFGERPGRGFWFALPVVLTGIWALSTVGRPVAEGGSVVAGVVFGVVTAVAYAASLVLLRVARSRSTAAHVDGISAMWSLTLGATIMILPIAAVQGVAGPAGWPADGWLIALAVGSQVVGWLLLTSSIHRLPAAATSVALLLQPVLALTWGALLLAEPIGPAQVGGAMLVLAGVAIAHRSTTSARVSPGTSIASPPQGGDVGR